MGEPWQAYRDPGEHALDARGRAELLAAQLECVVAWTASDGWPVGVVHWFLWRDERFWVTAGAGRSRIAALRARPQSCVVVSGTGAVPGPPRSVTARTLAKVHDDGRALHGWFAGELAAKAHGAGTATAERFARMLAETPRVVVELRPVSWTGYDAGRLRTALRRERAGQEPNAASDRPSPSRSQ